MEQNDKENAFDQNQIPSNNDEDIETHGVFDRSVYDFNENTIRMNNNIRVTRAQ